MKTHKYREVQSHPSSHCPAVPGAAEHPVAGRLHPSTARLPCRGCRQPRAGCRSWCGTAALHCWSYTTAGHRRPPPWCWGSAGSLCQRSAGIAGPGCTGPLGQVAPRARRGLGLGDQVSSHLQAARGGTDQDGGAPGFGPIGDTKKRTTRCDGCPIPGDIQGQAQPSPGTEHLIEL